MLSIDEKKMKLARSWHHYFEAVIYIELLGKGKKKIPRLEFANDMRAFTVENLIHIGLGIFEAESKKDLFDQIFHIIGHELQHQLSTTGKDFEANHKLCLNDACQKLAKDVLGKPAIRLTRDSDYDKFFAELFDKGVFIDKKNLMNLIHLLANSVEDGRIENLRTRKHPGFGRYRKIFRGKRWLKRDLRDFDYAKKELDELKPSEELNIILEQILGLATSGIYSRGFLALYGGTRIHQTVSDFIPVISRGVLAKTCKACMEEVRKIFNGLIDLFIEACKLDPEEVSKMMSMLEELLKEMIAELESQFSATPRDEEQGDGLPGKSPLGKSDLELELTKEEFEELKKEMDESEENEEDASVKITVKDNGENGDGEDSSCGSKTESEEKGNTDSEEKGVGDSTKSGSEASEENSDDKGESSGTSKESDKNSESESDSKTSKDFSGCGSSDAVPGLEDRDPCSTNPNEEEQDGNVEVDHDKISEEIEELMQEAAKASSHEFNLANADSKTDQTFRDAAEKLNPVKPAEIDLSTVKNSYRYDVNFVEKVRCYKPTERLPFELENKGKSLKNKVEEMIKNKQEPDMRGMRSGLLDTRRLHALATGELSIFKKKGEMVKPDVAAYILMDNSGSMGNGPGSTRYACCNAAAVLEEGFKEHMALKIAAFDAYGPYSVFHEVIKEFDESVNANLSYNFRNLGRGGAGNKDGYSIRVATEQLLARSEKDKILIIASDGLPTDYSGGYSEGTADVKNAVMQARKQGIKTIGMYMYHDQYESDFSIFKEMYAPEYIFASLDEIEDELTRVLKRYFR